MAKTEKKTPIQQALEAFPDAKPSGNHGWFSARCTGHDDTHASLSFCEKENGRVFFRCHAQDCSLESILAGAGLQERDLYPSGSYKPLRRIQPKLELIDLAYDKLLPWQFLFNEGVNDGYSYHNQSVCTIAYYTADGKEHTKVRVRLGLAGKESKWDEDTPGDMIAYGLHKLDMARKAGYCLIGEGESDAWTCWFHNIPFLGVPGAMNEKCLNGASLLDIPIIYIIQEPDDAGKKFYSRVHAQLRKTGYTGKIYCLPFKQLTLCKDPNALHQHLIKEGASFKTAIADALQKAIPHSVASELAIPAVISAHDLMAQQFPPINWYVPNILTEGLTLIAGKQKIGKSRWELQLGLALACGGIFLGSIKVNSYGVLYLALEDNERRLKERLSELLAPGISPPKNLHLVHKWPRMNTDGLHLLAAWLDEHPDVKIVLIDTWGRAKPLSRAQNGYDADVDAASGLQTLASERRIAILATAHMRKSPANDPLDELNATTGLSATADNILILKRERGEADASLWGTGREIDELDLALSFKNGMWQALGDGATHRLSKEQKEVIDILTQAGKPLGAKEIAELLRASDKRITDGTIRKRLYDMKQAGTIKELERGKYLPTTTGNVSNAGNISNAGNAGNVSMLPTLLSDENEVTRLDKPVSLSNGHNVTNVTTIPECPNCHTIVGMQYYANLHMYKHQGCGKWIGEVGA